MKRTTIVLAALAVLVALVAPVAAASLGDTTPMQTTSDCDGTDVGPGEDAGPPGFVADLVPDFLSDLIGSLPVPNFVKSLFGAC
jgi:hypothetical protein